MLGFIFSGEFQLSEMREMGHGEKWGSLDGMWGGVGLQRVMGYRYGGKCVGAGTEGVGVGVGFSRLPLFLVAAVWFSLWFE